MSLEKIFARINERSSFMRQEQHAEQVSRRGIFRPVSEPMRWVLFLWIWFVTWVPGMLLLIGWQVSPFISLFFAILGIGLFLFIVVRYGLARMRGSWGLLPAERASRRSQQSSQTQGPDVLDESATHAQPSSSSSTGDHEQFQVSYPEFP